MASRQAICVEWYPKVELSQALAALGSAAIIWRRNIDLRAGLLSIRVGYKKKNFGGRN
jgi:hypothetical protein